MQLNKTVVDIFKKYFINWNRFQAIFNVYLNIFAQNLRVYVCVRVCVHIFLIQTNCQNWFLDEAISCKDSRNLDVRFKA